MTKDNTVEVDVQKIMEEIRRNIQMEEDMNTLPRFEDIPVSGGSPEGEKQAQATAEICEERIDWPALQEAVKYVNTHYDIPYYWPFSGSKVKVFMKRVVRKIAKCLLAPIVAMQNMMNAHLVRCVNNLRHGVRELFGRTDAQAGELQRLELACTAQLDAMRRVVSAQEAGFKAEIRRIEVTYSKKLQAALSQAAHREDEIRRIEGDYIALQEDLSARMESQADEIRRLEDLHESELSAMRYELEAGYKAEISRIEGTYSEEIKAMSSQAALREEEIKRLEALCDEAISTLKRELSELTATSTEALDAVRRRLEEQVETLQNVRAGVERLTQTEGSIQGRLDAQERKIVYLDRQSDSFSAGVAKTIMEHMRRDDAPAGQQAAPQEEPTKSDGNTYRIVDYFKFQNDFRGSRSTIMERQEMYLPYFQNAAADVLDIGCGRGEFLRLMKDHGIPAFGVDLYPEYVIEGEMNGLDIRQGDGIAFLRDTKEQYGGIFACQVIEHISFEQLQELCAAAYKKLVKGSYLILETPNPTCLSIFTSTFYVDPTHNKPVHPLLLEYVLREVGFTEIKILFSDSSRTGYSLPHIESKEISNLDEVNAAITRVSDLLYGCLDYAVIAKK